MKKSIALVDCRICEQSVHSLERMGFSVVKVQSFSRLSQGVESHPDMIMLIEGASLFTHREYFMQNESLFAKIRECAPYLSFFLSDEGMYPEYPHDILFNAYIHDGIVFGRHDRLSIFVSMLTQRGYELKGVKQGYASCSCCKVGDGVVTSDISLHRTLVECGIDALLIESGHIALPCHDYGFIGGASGYCDGKVYFNGSIDLHPSGKDILHFAKKHGCEVVCLHDGPLTDVGKILFI